MRRGFSLWERGTEGSGRLRTYRFAGSAHRAEPQTFQIDDLKRRAVAVATLTAVTPCHHRVIPSGAKDLFPPETYYDTKFHLRYAQMRSGFFVLAKLSGERRCSASLTEAKQSQGGKDARSCVWIRWNLV